MYSFKLKVTRKFNMRFDDTNPTKEKIEFIRKNENQLVSTLEQPYVLLTIAVEETHVNLFFSDSLKEVLDKNDILDGYVVPLLASNDKNTLFAKVSAATLNGYAAIADKIADSKEIEKFHPAEIKHIRRYEILYDILVVFLWLNKPVAKNHLLGSNFDFDLILNLLILYKRNLALTPYRIKLYFLLYSD